MVSGPSVHVGVTVGPGVTGVWGGTGVTGEGLTGSIG
jgi:hypothetical protein